MKKHVSLALSSGGARGIAHIGIIEELEARGYEIISIGGTSMGALVAAIYASGNLNEAKEWLYSLSKLDIIKLADLTLNANGLVKGAKVFKKLKEFITVENIEDFEMPYVAVAADIIKKEEKIFTEGSVMDAVRASIAIPSVFTPWKIGTSKMIDGSVLNPLPINHMKRFDGDILVAVNVNALFPCKFSKKKKSQAKSVPNYIKKKWKEKFPSDSNNSKIGLYTILSDAIYMMHNQLAHLMVQHYQPEVDISISRDIAMMFDFHNGQEIVEIGRKAAKEALDKYEKP